MSVKNRDVALFDSRMKKTNKIADGLYRATSAKRKKEIIPEGIKVYDTDEEQMYVGNGTTAGGVVEGGNKNIRKISVASGGTTLTTQVDESASGTNISFTDTKFGQLRTGDGVTFTESTGTLPSGLTEAEYFVIKTPDAAANTVLFASSRENALAGTDITIYNSGAVGWYNAISTVAADKGEGMMFVDADVNVTIPMPIETQGEDFGITIRKSVGDGVVTVSGLDASGNVTGLDLEASGDTSIALRAGTGDYVDLTLDTDGNQYIITNLVNS